MDKSIVNSGQAPEPVGAYPHARKVGNLLFLSGMPAISFFVSLFQIQGNLETKQHK